MWHEIVVRFAVETGDRCDAGVCVRYRGILMREMWGSSVSINSEKGEKVSCTVNGPPAAPTSLLSHHDVRQTPHFNGPDLLFPNNSSVGPSSRALDSGCVSEEGEEDESRCPSWSCCASGQTHFSPIWRNEERTHLPGKLHYPPPPSKFFKAAL